eukprot:5618976-Prymnesium_polylepis.2
MSRVRGCRSSGCSDAARASERSASTRPRQPSVPASLGHVTASVRRPVPATAPAACDVLIRLRARRCRLEVGSVFGQACWQGEYLLSARAEADERRRVDLHQVEKP